MRKYGDGISMRKYEKVWESIKYEKSMSEVGVGVEKVWESMRKYEKVLGMRKLVWVWESMSEVEVEKVLILRWGWESMSEVEKVWESMRKYEKLLSMRKYVRSWESMRKHEKVWESMRKHEKVWESIKYEKVVLSMRKYVRSWESWLYWKCVVITSMRGQFFQQAGNSAQRKSYFSFFHFSYFWIFTHDLTLWNTL